MPLLRQVAPNIKDCFPSNWLAGNPGLASKHGDGVLIVDASPWTVALTQMLHNMKVSVSLSDSNWHNLGPMRVAGIPVFYGDILSEFAEESVGLTYIRIVLTTTRNDAHNARVCTARAGNRTAARAATDTRRCR